LLEFAFAFSGTVYITRITLLHRCSPLKQKRMSETRKIISFIGGGDTGALAAVVRNFRITEY
jgi:hypothetical protein